MSGLDIIAKNQLKNQDNIIEVSPISIPVEIIKKGFSGGSDTSSPLFGYESPDPQPAIKSKAIIKYNPDRVFLKNSGIFFQNELPIIAWFKHADNVQRGDTIRTSTLDKDTEFDEEFQVIDIKSKGYSQSQGKVWILAPTRG